MESDGVRRRPVEANSALPPVKLDIARPNHSKPNGWMQTLRLTLLVIYFLVSCICMHFQQFLGVPLYWINQDWYYAWQAFVKQYFGLLLVTMQEWWAPIEVRISGDASIKGQIKQLKNGRVKLEFPERVLMLSNHQLYHDWVFMWWTAFTTRMHGHFFIILKDSIRFIPLLGPGMMFFSFIFLSRKWETDKPRFQHRLSKLKSSHRGAMAGTDGKLDPMWLLIFPEGTTLCKNGRAASRKWADKTGIQDLKHTLLPRTRGLQLCLQELEGTVDWVYDCTIRYEGIPPGEYGQDVFTLKRVYVETSGPRSVSMHWRRFAMSSVPFRDDAAFDAWLLDRWSEKDDLLEYYEVKGRFPGDVAAISHEDGDDAANARKPQQVGSSPGRDDRDAEVSADVAPNHPLEFVQIFTSVLAVPFVWRLAAVLIRLLKLALLVVSLGKIKA